MTLEEEFGTLAGIQVAFIGDGDNVCHSLIEAAGLAGFGAARRDAAGLRAVRRRSWIGRRRRGCSDRRHDRADATTPLRQSSGADAVYADVWTSMGREAEREAAQDRPSRASRSMPGSWRRASNAAIFLHCLPAHRGEEVTDDGDGRTGVAESGRRRRTGLHTETALLYAVLTGDFAGALLGESDRRRLGEDGPADTGCGGCAR